MLISRKRTKVIYWSAKYSKRIQFYVSAYNDTDSDPVLLKRDMQYVHIMLRA